ncbi:hypothetical protein KCA24_14135, partial [Escherichia coli]|nr:hypothetical protein [Escherichia coli]
MNTALAQQIANEGGVEAWMIAQQHKSLLRFLTCGSVDDGKSTLIGLWVQNPPKISKVSLNLPKTTEQSQAPGGKSVLDPRGGAPTRRGEKATPIAGAPPFFPQEKK